MLSLTVNETLMLRTYLEDDAAEHFDLINTNRKHLRAFLSWADAHNKVTQSLEYIRHTRQQQDTQQALMMGIFKDYRLIGEVAMHQWDYELKKAQIGYWIAKDAEGKGIMQSCLHRFFNYIFQTLDMNKLEIRFIPSNTRSAKIAERMNCKIEGVLRDSYFINGKLEDLVITGVLREEWKAEYSV